MREDLFLRSAAETWLPEAFGHVWRELAQNARTFAAFAVHPGRSAREWQAGEKE